jgi:hypothetical protein
MSEAQRLSNQLLRDSSKNKRKVVKEELNGLRLQNKTVIAEQSRSNDYKINLNKQKVLLEKKQKRAKVLQFESNCK